jgi:hypothetical protein
MSVSLRYESIVLLQIMAACALVTSAVAQDPQLPRLPAPPPMHLVSKSDRTELDETRDPKARMHASMTLAEAHLTRAEKLTDDKKYDQALAELGSYLGVIGDLRDYCAKLDTSKNSTRDLYRHFEYQVHTHIPRLAVIQRTTPVEYVRNIKDAEEFIKDTRAEALDSFYGHSVLKEPVPEKALTPPPGGAKDPVPTKHP